MPGLRDALDSFPAKLAIISAAVAASSALIFPAVLLPANVDSLGATGSLLILIVFLVVWAVQKDVRRWRKPIFIALGIVSAWCLWTIMTVNSEYVDTLVIGQEAEATRYLVGSELTPLGQGLFEAAGSPSRPVFIRMMGPDRIPDAWGSSFSDMRLRYSAAYLILAAAITIMLGASEMAVPKDRT